MGRDLNGKNLGTGFSQRKDGRYYARATINGQKIDIYDFNLANLKKRFNEAKAEIIRQQVTERKDLKLSEWFDEWFEICKRPSLKNTSAARGYRRKFVNRYGAYLGDTLVKDLRQIHIQRATNEMIEKGLNVRNIGDALSVLRQCLDTAVANRIILTNPCIGIALPNDQVVSERRVLEHWEQDLLLKVVDGRFYRELYHICLLTGMRIGEIGGLTWDDVYFDKKVILVNRALSISYDKGKTLEMTTPKTANSVRVIPFFDDVEDYLVAWKKKQDAAKKQCGSRWRNKEYGDLVFTTSLGSPVTRYAFQHDIRKVVDDMRAIEAHNATKEGRKPREIGSIYPHAFRHTFATRCFENNMDPVFVQRVMGHSNYSTTVSYTHILENVIERETIKTKNFLNGGKPNSDS